MEKITQEYSQEVNNATSDNVEEIITRISNYPDVKETHDRWEQADKDWKDATKYSRDDATIMSKAALVREHRKAKDAVADQAAILACQAAENSGILIEYTEKTLGKATQIGDVEELSADWHRLRQGGIGGSTVSKVLGFHWKSHCGYPVYYNKAEQQDIITGLALEKMATVGEVHNPTSGVLFRGHQWEPALLALFAKQYAKNVAVSKATWRGGIPYQVVNVDGIILDDEGNPEGLVECKTSSREWTWRWGVPVGYRAQVLWYLNATGLDYAYVVVRFDSGSFDFFRINADDTIDGTDKTKTITEYLDDLDQAWVDINRYREYPLDLWDDNSGLYGELDGTLGFVLDDGSLDPDIELFVEDSVILKIDTVQVYERMDPKFTKAHIVTADDKTYVCDDVSDVLYDIPEAPRQAKTISSKDIEKIIGDKTIVAVDTETYDYVSRVFGSDGVVNISAVRRFFEVAPAEKDFEKASDVLSWLEDALDAENFEE